MKNIESLLKGQFSVGISKFRDRVVGKSPWLPRSILMSEAFAFCAIADMLEVDAIIESGIYHGRSTYIFANFFNSDIPILAIDRKKFKRTTKSRLEPYENVRLCRADGLEEIPILVDTISYKHIAIMIDGPKWMAAVELARKLMERENVVMIAIHDMFRSMDGKPNESRAVFEGWPEFTFFTDSEWFISEYGKLDEGESRLDKKQGLTWEPYIMKGAGRADWILGSYGMTLGISFKEEII